MSVSTDGQQGDGDSNFPCISSNGRFVAFQSLATTLVPGDTNGARDVFVHDCATGVTERASVSSSGEQGNGNSFNPVINADGRFVVFWSLASNLVAGDTNGSYDVFVRDRLTGTTECASVDANWHPGNGTSYLASISADGRFVAFGSSASNLVPADANGKSDVFVRDRLAGTTELVSVSTSGQQGDGDSSGCAISGDGRYVVFGSTAVNFVPPYWRSPPQLYIRDRLQGTTALVTHDFSGQGKGIGTSTNPQITADAGFVVFQSDAPDFVPIDINGADDIFVYDRAADSMDLVSLAPDGSQTSFASVNPSITWNGRYITWDSLSPVFVPDDTNRVYDVFLRDRITGANTRVAVGMSGEQANSGTFNGALSADGRFVAFSSYASNLVPGDTNGREDVFVTETGVPQSSISGTIEFEGLAAGAAPPASVDLEVRWNGISIGTWPMTVAGDGSFSAVVPPWAEDVSIEPSHWLRRTLSVDASQGPVGGVVFDLVNGDANGDNSVGIMDLSTVLLNFGSYEPMADLDESGLVGLSDLSLVLLDFGLRGDP